MKQKISLIDFENEKDQENAVHFLDQCFKKNGDLGVYGNFTAGLK